MSYKTKKPSRLGLALIVSGASGTGKTTVLSELRQKRPELAFSISCCTRLPRQGEFNGQDYHFITVSEFQQKIQENLFLEYAEVHGNYYGTLYSEILNRVLQHQDVLLDIDVQGAQQVRLQAQKDPILKNCIESVFIGPPNFQELEKRLRGRGTESEEVIRRRLTNARCEMEHWRDYDFLVINKQVSNCVNDLIMLIDMLHKKTCRLEESGFYE